MIENFIDQVQNLCMGLMLSVVGITVLCVRSAMKRPEQVSAAGQWLFRYLMSRRR